MQNKMLKVVFALLISATACSQNSQNIAKVNEATKQNDERVNNVSHSYGGWYCPDNLGGFSPVDITKWEDVPVINGRLPTKEETQNGSSLIYVDAEKYPNAKVLDIKMPKLASFNSPYTKRKELIILIQAINVSNDSVVGYRYLNGGNGSGWLKDVHILSDDEIKLIPESRFVKLNVQIKATQDKIWQVLTLQENAAKLQPVFDKNNALKTDWRKTSNVNFHYANSGELTSSYADKLFGSFYVQNDYLKHNDKFLLLENEDTKTTELKIASGPYGNDFESQKKTLIEWSQKVKALSEKD